MMISFDEAVEHIRSVAVPLGTQTVRLEQASGRVLSRPVIAQIDSPRSDVSTRDGYAVREADLGPFPVSLPVLGESFAGSASGASIREGTCARIFTGASLPPGADRVVMQEFVRRDGDIAVIEVEPEGDRWVRRFASDFARGDTLVQPGELLGSRALVAAAGADVGTLEVYLQPRLHILSTGDELEEPGTAHGSANAVPESASLGVASLAERRGANGISRTLIRDDLLAIQAAADAAAKSANVIVMIGGASVGEKDFAKAALEPLGLDLLFSKVAIKPGKPAWLGRIRETLVLGLPGNPTSAMVTARILLAPLLAGMNGQPIETALEWRTMVLGSALGASAQRETFHRARLRNGLAEPLPNQDSGAQKALVDADLLVRQAPNSPGLGAGAEVQTLDF